MATRRRGVGASPRIGRGARELLLAVLDRPSPTITAAALESKGAAIGRQLVSSGLLVPGGHEAVAASDDDDDAPVSLTWSAEQEQYGYFSAKRGWVSVPPEAIAFYRVDVVRFATVLLKPFGARAPVALPLSSGNTLLWDLGDVRLPRRTYRHPLWIVRCAGDTGVWSELRSLAAARPPERTRILLATAAPTRLPREPMQRHLLVSIHDVLDASGSLVLDGSALAARFGSPSSGREVGEPLLIEADGRVVWLHGKEFRFPKGERQRAIIRYLYERYRDGDLTVSVASLAEDVGLPLKARIRDYFKDEYGRRVMSQLLFEKAGTCGFRLNDRAT